MAAAYPVVEAPFMADQVVQCSRFGRVDRIAAVDARIALAAVVVDQQQGLIEVRAYLSKTSSTPDISILKKFFIWHLLI